MVYKFFVKYFLLFVSILLFLIITFNLSIDPYNKYGINLFNIKYKLTRDDRGFKIGQINAMNKIDNLIIGSSRSQTLDPYILSMFLGGISYNFGVGGGKIEDALGVLLYLKKENKLPKNILLALDFNAFNSSHELHSDFLNSKELNFLNNQVNQLEIAHFLSFDTTRSSFKTLKAHFKNEKPIYYFNEYGLAIGPDEKIDEKRIEELSNNYFQTQYTNGEYKIDSKRIEWYKQIIEIITKNNINLKVILTPVYEYQFSLIENNKKLNESYIQLLKMIKDNNSFENLMENKQYRENISYFIDNVHFKKPLGDKILIDIYSKEDFKNAVQ